jgi:hypothetical protein
MTIFLVATDTASVDADWDNGAAGESLQNQ